MHNVHCKQYRGSLLVGSASHKSYADALVWAHKVVGDNATVEHNERFVYVDGDDSTVCIDCSLE